MAKVIVVANQKGGVAKTTTSGSMAASLKKKGYRVLAIDLDPQGNLSDSVGADAENKPTIYEVMKREVKASEAIQVLDAFDIIPANIMLAAAEQELPPTGRDRRLKITVESVKENYDFIIVDTPPSLGVLTVNALVFGDEAVIPTNAGIFAVKGIQQLNATINDAQELADSKIKVAGILLTRYNPRTIISQDFKGITEELAETIGAPVYNTYIRNAVVVEEAQANNQDIFTYRSSSSVAEDYDAFVDEYLERRK